MGPTSDGSEPESTTGPEAPDDSLETAERNHIKAILGKFGGSRVGAAAALGIARSTLLAKIRRYNLEP